MVVRRQRCKHNQREHLLVRLFKGPKVIPAHFMRLSGNTGKVSGPKQDKGKNKSLSPS